MVWSQPEVGAKLYIDLGLAGSDYHRITMPATTGTLALTSQLLALGETSATNDTTLQTNINTEATARANADTILQNQKVGGNTNYGGTDVDNLNTLTKSGFYTCYNNATGVPNTGTGSFFVIHTNSNVGVGYAMQIAMAYNVNNVFVRKKYSSTWGGWYEQTANTLTQTLSNKTLASPNVTTALNFNGHALGTAGGLESIVSISLGTNSYIKYSSGRIIQWGYSARSGTGFQTITFPLAFTTLRSLVAVGRNTDADTANIRSVAVRVPTTTNFTIRSDYDSSLGFYWHAEGV
jgi:hypothetical protein